MERPVSSFSENNDFAFEFAKYVITKTSNSTPVNNLSPLQIFLAPNSSNCIPSLNRIFFTYSTRLASNPISFGILGIWLFGFVYLGIGFDLVGFDDVNRFCVFGLGSELGATARRR